ncbi:MAG: D-alanyl-D-alanine carboxypeptidase, partial [Nitrospirae bacterium]|nr:D-alanyl-D-alanine carboxypeptidase [Nitrospirota bacterium]
SRKASLAAPTKVGFREGDRVTIETLLYAALMKSANDASVALAEAVAGSEDDFVRLMNRTAIAIGAMDTKFINANGLPGKGQHITAYDLAKIMRQAIKHPVLKEIIGTRITEVSAESGRPIFIKNTNKLLWSDEEVLGGKTGYTRQAKHCFVCAGEKDNETMIVALLGASSRDLLWKETEDLMAFGSKVMNSTEEPVVYLTKADRDIPAASTLVHQKGKGIKGQRVAKKKSGKYRAVLAENKLQQPSKTDRKHKIAARKKGKGKAVLAKAPSKKRDRTGTKIARNKKPKRSHMARKYEDGFKG